MSQSAESSKSSQAEDSVVAIKQRSPLDEALREGATKCCGKRLKPRSPSTSRSITAKSRKAAGGAHVQRLFAPERSPVIGVGTLRTNGLQVDERCRGAYKAIVGWQAIRPRVGRGDLLERSPRGRTHHSVLNASPIRAHAESTGIVCRRE